MIDFGTVRPGTTLYIPFATYDSNDPSASVTLTGLAVTDIEVYKDGSTTQRASDAGYTLLDTDGIDFDTTTGIHGFSINLADNTTANFWEAGSQYWVVVASITVDAATINFIAATFRIGYPGAMLDTTIATLSSQTSFTLTAGSADNDAYNGCTAVIHDVASGIQIAQALILDYTGSTKTVTLAADPGIFTMAATDNISIMPANLQVPKALPDAAGGLPVSDAGGLDLDTLNSNVSAVLADTGTDGVVLANDAITAAKIAADAIGASELAADAANEIADAILNRDASSSTTNSTLGAIVNDLENGGRLDLIVDELTTQGDTNESKIDTIDTNVDTLVSRITSTLFSGITSLAEWLGLIAGKQIGDTTARTELRATGAGSGTFDETADSLEAVRDRGDAAWATATGFSTHTAADVRSEMDANSTQLAAIVADTNELQTDDVPGLIATAQADLDTITGIDGVTLATTQGNYAPSTHNAAAVWAVGTRTLTANTNFNDPTAAAIATAILDADASSHTTNATLGAIVNDLENGGRLDAILDELTTQGDTNETAIGALNDPTAAAIATAVLTTAMTESYATTGAAPTAAQALFEILQNLTESANSSTTRTVKKRDQSTTAKTYTYDDATSPTSITAN